MKTRSTIHKMAVTAMLGVIGFVLMLLEFPVPFLIPDFIKVDFSELPALLGAFSLGPVWGMAVCLIKNLLKAVFASGSFGVGELANFMLGALLVLPAGIIYRRKPSRKTALIGAVAGSVLSGLGSIAINFYITYPFYSNFMPIDAILAAYQAIASGIGLKVNSLLQVLVVFNMPFTIAKNLLNTALCMAVYKRLSPMLKGTRRS